MVPYNFEFDCPAVGPGFTMPQESFRHGTLAGCQDCGTTIFRSDACDDMVEKLREQARANGFSVEEIDAFVFTVRCHACAGKNASRPAAEKKPLSDEPAPE